MQSREKVHDGGDCGDLQKLDFMCLYNLGDVRTVLTKAKLIFWKQLDGERSGRTKRRHLMSCCKSPALQFN